jgi:hypothetical protein
VPFWSRRSTAVRPRPKPVWPHDRRPQFALGAWQKILISYHVVKSPERRAM